MVNFNCQCAWRIGSNYMQKDAHTLAGIMHGILGDKGQMYAEPKFQKMSKFAALGTFGPVTADGLFVPPTTKRPYLL